MTEGSEQDNTRPGSKSGLASLVKSTLGAAIGVQSREVYEDDFRSKSPLPYIVAGIVFTLLFIGSVILVVNLVLSSTQV